MGKTLRFCQALDTSHLVTVAGPSDASYSAQYWLTYRSVPALEQHGQRGVQRGVTAVQALAAHLVLDTLSDACQYVLSTTAYGRRPQVCDAGTKYES